MEKRQCGRTYCNLNASVILGNTIYSGTIEDISQEGLRYRIDKTARCPGNFLPEDKGQLHISFLPGLVIQLSCSIKWSLRSSSSDKTLIGLKVINPPECYKKSIKNLAS